jgi:hypothetical protein
MRGRVHHHPCQRCHAKTECGGDWEQNYGGEPEVICPEYHYSGGFINPDFLCETCAEAPEPEEAEV